MEEENVQDKGLEKVDKALNVMLGKDPEATGR